MKLPSKRQWKWIGMAVLAVLILIVIFQNTETGETKVLFITFDARDRRGARRARRSVSAEEVNGACSTTCRAREASGFPRCLSRHKTAP